MTKLNSLVLASATLLLSVAAQAGPVFQGRLADGSASDTCTASGVDKCTYFYDATLDITILNNWDLGIGFWSADSAPGSAQAIAAAAGLAASGLSGWVLPTGDRLAPAGAENQYMSIWNSVGRTYEGLAAQFDRTYSNAHYWTSTEYLQDPSLANSFQPKQYFFYQVGSGFRRIDELYFVAVRAGDVANASASVPEPQTLALALLALGATVVARRRRSG